MDKSLLCAESLHAEERFAGKDKAILEDERVLEHLLQTEAAYMPQRCFRTCDLDPGTRKIVVKWMLEVKYKKKFGKIFLGRGENFRTWPYWFLSVGGGNWAAVFFFFYQHGTYREGRLNINMVRFSSE